MIKVLFVCLGNICRSPMAEGLFIHKVNEAGLADAIGVDSCGTGGWHVGERADRRMRATAASHGVELPSRARKLVETDFQEFDYILPMDQSNQRDVNWMKDRVAGNKAQVFLMRHFDELGRGREVPDPYYGGQNGFEEVYDILDRSTESFLNYLRQEHNL